MLLGRYWSNSGSLYRERDGTPGCPATARAAIVALGLLWIPGWLFTRACRIGKQVDTADYNAFDEEQTKDYDVAILDKDGIEWASLDINVSREYSRATVSIGVPGAFWIRRVSRKMGYM